MMRSILVGWVILVILSAGCVTQEQPTPQNPDDNQQPIGGERDEHGCLTAAGYSYDDGIGACTRNWEVDAEGKRRAAMIAVDYVGQEYGLSVVGFEVMRCLGCFNVYLSSPKAPSTRVTVIDWAVSEVGEGTLPQEGSIDSFEDCVAAGYPVMESYPRQCRTKDGKHFVEDVEVPFEKPTVPPLAKEVCESGGGYWEECASRCRIEKMGKEERFDCPEICEPLCLCAGYTGADCPQGYVCRNPSVENGIKDGTGYCVAKTQEEQNPAPQPSSTPQLSKVICEDAGGRWNECGSRCQIDNQNREGVACPALCEPLCECGGFAGWLCPEGYACQMPPGLDMLGYCVKQSGEERAREAALRYVSDTNEYQDYNGRDLTVTSVSQGRCTGCWTIELHYLMDSMKDAERTDKATVTVTLQDWEVTDVVAAYGSADTLTQAECDALGGRTILYKHENCAVDERDAGIISDVKCQCKCCVPLESSVNPCTLDPDPGRCRAAIPRYYFDEATGSCEEFIWGGCGGTVPFDSLIECTKECTPTRVIEKYDDPGVCARAFISCEEGQEVYSHETLGCGCIEDGTPKKTYCTPEQRGAEICTMEYRPVCGDNGKTYSNPCMACADKTVDYWIEGACAEE